METRKIQKVGGGTYTVSLPKEWTREQGVTSGDAVQVHTHIDGLLVVRADDPGAAADLTVPVAPGATDAIEQVLRAAYAVGTKTVRLTAAEGFSTEQRRVIDRTVGTLTGTSVVESDETTVVVRAMMDSGEVSVRQTVRQAAFLARSMHRDAAAALTGDAEPGGLGTRDDGVDRLFAVIDRAFSRGLRRLAEVDDLGLTRPELFELWLATRELERVADHAEGIGAVARTLDAPIEGANAAAVRDLAERARTLVDGAVDCVVGDAGAGEARRLLAARDRLRADVTSAEEGCATPELAVVLDRLRRTAEHGGNVAEVGLRRAVREGDLGGAVGGPGGENAGAHPSGG